MGTTRYILKYPDLKYNEIYVPFQRILETAILYSLKVGSNVIFK